jgi:hypothetical protein
VGHAQDTFPRAIRKSSPHDRFVVEMRRGRERRCRGSACLVRIYIRSMDAPIEVSADQRIVDWKRVRVRLTAQAERLLRLSGAACQEPPEPRRMLPSILTLEGHAGRPWPAPGVALRAEGRPIQFPVLIAGNSAFAIGACEEEPREPAAAAQQERANSQ